MYFWKKKIIQENLSEIQAENLEKNETIYLGQDSCGVFFLILYIRTFL